VWVAGGGQEVEGVGGEGVALSCQVKRGGGVGKENGEDGGLGRFFSGRWGEKGRSGRYRAAPRGEREWGRAPGAALGGGNRSATARSRWVQAVRPCRVVGPNRGGGGRLTGGAPTQWRVAAVESVEKGNPHLIEFKRFQIISNFDHPLNAPPEL
jgi:hypothetical protein